MARKNIKVDFGYEPETPSFRGTVFAIDSFNDVSFNEFSELVHLMDSKKFDKLVVYPLHEKNLRRMDIEISTKYHYRMSVINDIISDLDKTFVPISVDNLDGKRKKYTPIDFILTHLTSKNDGPYFLYLTKEIANKFANFSSFETWIRQVRLIIKEDSNEKTHSNLVKYMHRIEYI